MTYLIDGVTPLPENGDLGWGTILNAAINEIDGRFTYSSPDYGLANTVISSSLTSVGTLTSLAVSGNATVGGSLTVTGNVTINGTTTTINSTTITTDDIVLTLGGDTAPTADDNKDRGIEFRWHNGSSAKLGFFGFDDSTGKLAFIPDATNTSQVFSGTLGTIDVGAVHINGSQIAAADLSNGTTGSGSVVLATSPTLTTPTLGVATATSVNKVAITAPATGATLTIADGKTLTASNTLTFTGTDSSSVAFGAGGTVAYTANKLSAFASTTSSELAGVVSDETGSGALVFGTSPTLSTPIIDNPRLGYTTTATAAGTTVLTSTSNYRQFFTGSSTQTVTLPVASTMTLGQAFEIHNNSTGAVTVNSSGGNAVIVVEGNRSAIVTCILTSGTTAASWDADVTGATSTTGTGALVFGTSPTIATPVLTLSTATSTADGRIAWDSTNDKIIVGDGSSTREFASSTRSINQATLTTNNYTLVLADKDKLVEINNGATANTLTVPLNSSVPFPVGTEIVVVQTGAGQTTLTPTGGVTINGTPGLKISAQWGTVTLVKRSTDGWLAYGNLAV